MRYIAADFGAGSGRIIVGSVSGNQLQLEEIHRFPNRQIKLNNSLYWDFLSLMQELKKGLAIAFKKYDDIVSIAIDTWGVDFGLLDANGKLLGNPYCYRDTRTDGILNEAFKKTDKETIYSIAGIQFMEINSAFQLLSMQLSNDAQLNAAKDLLFMPDLFAYFLTGVKKNEYTIASTSNLLDAHTKQWSSALIQSLHIREDLFQEIIHPGTIIGTLTQDICEELNGYPINVVAVGAHDTACAAAITYNPEVETAFLSSGTWSLIGLHLEHPILTKEAMLSDLTNEGGIGNKITYLKNITGLWMLQKTISEWESQSLDTDYAMLLKKAGEAKAFSAIIDTDDKRFSNPDSMIDAIKDYCRDSGQAVPHEQGQIVRIILESLAIKYKEAIAQIESTTTTKIEQLQIVGGGCQNDLLNQFTADATALPVIAGPVEATAIGNILTQALANGEIKNTGALREVIDNSFSLKKYQPQNTAAWNQFENQL